MNTVEPFGVSLDISLDMIFKLLSKSGGPDFMHGIIGGKFSVIVYGLTSDEMDYCCSKNDQL